MNVQKGFTLIELMIVVAIIGILAGVALPQYQTYVARSQFTRVMAEASSLRTAVELCTSEGRSGAATLNDAGTTLTAGICYVDVSGSTLQTGSCGSASAATTVGCPLVTVGTGTDASTIVATFGNSASTALATQTLTWTRDGTNGTWTCASTVTNQKYVDQGCLGTGAPAGGGGGGGGA